MNSNDTKNEPVLAPLDARWDDAKSFKDLIVLNKEFINGKLDQTPYHGGPLEHGDDELKRKLVQLHDYGLLTVDGQDATCKYGYCTTTAFYSHKNRSKQTYYIDMEQRPYLSFYMDLVENESLANSLLQQIQASDLMFVMDNIATNDHVTNLKKGSHYCVTRYRYGLDKTALHTQKWFMSTSVPENVLQYYWGDAAPILEKTMYFDVAMREYGKGDLESILLDMCRKNRS